MINFREVNEDIMKDWLDFREENFLCVLNEQDKKHIIGFDEISERILNNVSDKNIKYVKNQLKLLDNNYIDYVTYWNEKYYRNGFVDGIQLLIGSIDL